MRMFSTEIVFYSRARLPKFSERRRPFFESGVPRPPDLEELFERFEIVDRLSLRWERSRAMSSDPQFSLPFYA